MTTGNEVSPNKKKPHLRAEHEGTEEEMETDS